MDDDSIVRAKKIVRATWHSGPHGLKRTIDDVASAIANARAAGFAEAIEKAAKVAADFEDEGDLTGELIAEKIRALAPVATTEEP